MAKRAVCIGINDYPGTNSDLAGCVNDAHDWAAVLTQRGFSVQTIVDQQATRQQMRNAIHGLVASAKHGDSIVIQYSGHGSFVPDRDGDEPDGTDECLCPYDIDTNGPIIDDELYTIFSQVKKGVKVLMISDACHSGTVTRFAPITTPPTSTETGAPRRTVRFLPPAVYLPKRDVSRLGTCRPTRPAHPLAHARVLLLSGCQDHEYSYDAFFKGRPNGAFSFVAIRALATLPADATYADWFAEIRKSLPSRQYPQTPNLHGTDTMKQWKALA